MEKQEKEIYIQCLELSAKNASNTIDRDEILEKIRELQDGEKDE